MVRVGDEAQAHIGCSVVEVTDEIHRLRASFGPQQSIQLPWPEKLVRGCVRRWTTGRQKNTPIGMRDLNLGTVFLLCRLTSAWRGWSSDSGRCWCICGTAARPRDSTAPASRTVAFAPSPLPPSPPWATLSPSKRQIAHFRGYRRTQRPGTTSANTPFCLPPSDWMQAQKAWKKWEKLKCKEERCWPTHLHITHAGLCSR